MVPSPDEVVTAMRKAWAMTPDLPAPGGSR